MLAFDAPTKAVGAVVCAAMLVTGAFDEDLSRGLTELIGSKCERKMPSWPEVVQKLGQPPAF
jgi:hypothetical protein